MKMLKEAEKLAPNDPEILWRIARGYFDFADQDPDNEEVQKANIYPGFEYAKRTVELDNTNAKGHKWYAILIGRIGEVEGTKQKIINSYEVRDHTLKAIELDPKDDGNYHVMGRWNYALADLSWLERQIASIIYAKPPKASFEEAVKFFKKAKELDPEDLRNYLWLGKTYIQLDREEDARQILEKAISMKAESDSDRAIQKKAREILEDL
jgi:tetratricopeptide (TPR) repeat protein